MLADERISKTHAAALFCGLCFSLPLASSISLTSFGLADRDWAADLSGSALLAVVGHAAFGKARSGVLGRGAAVLERFLVPCFALTWCWLSALPAGCAYEAVRWPNYPDRASRAYQAAVAASAIALEYWALRSTRWRMVSSVAIISGLVAYWLCAVSPVLGPLSEYMRYSRADTPGSFPWIVWLAPSYSRIPT